jgi:hypothetical protein
VVQGWRGNATSAGAPLGLSMLGAGMYIQNMGLLLSCWAVPQPAAAKAKAATPIIMILAALIGSALTIKTTDEQHQEPPESRRDVRTAHSVHRFLSGIWQFSSPLFWSAWFGTPPLINPAGHSTKRDG